MIPTTREALRQAIDIIRTWNGMGMEGPVEETCWRLYQTSPEMKPILAAVRRLGREDVLRDALIQARDLIEPYMDTVDGDYGQPAPNKAMRAVQVIDAALNEP